MLSIEDLVDDLVESTRSGQLKWGASHLTFETEIDGFYIKTWKWSDEESDINGVTVQLLDRKHQLLDEAVADEYNTRYTKLSLVHDLARRSANDIPDVISNLKKSLKTLPKKKK